MPGCTIFHRTLTLRQILAMAVVTRHPTKQDWDHVRPTVERFWKEQQTAEWTAKQLGLLFGYRVTYANVFRFLCVVSILTPGSKKMVYDRLKEWHAPPKYRRSKQRQRVARAVSTPPADVHFHAALSSIGVFLDDLTEKAMPHLPALEVNVDFQRIVAEALMAISSTSYDTRAVWRELSAMEDRVESMVGTFSVAIHPRVLSVLLRVLVQNQQTDETQRATIRAFRGMIWRKAIKSLQPSHPVASLCALDLPPERTEDFLEKFTTQMNTRLHDQISELAPDFVVLEKIYTARALASFGFSGSADKVLESAASLNMQDAFTKADYHRTVGFSQFQKNTLALTEAALGNLRIALNGFEGVGKGSSTEAMYVHYNLGSVFERKQDFENCTHHLEVALDIWEANSASHQQHGGIKYVRDLDEAYKRTGRLVDSNRRHDRYASYFEESPNL